MSNWEYGEVYKKYDMSGIIIVPNGTLKVHNIFDPIPDFMREADCIFSDPPCSLGNINTFYTKAGRADYQATYEPFAKRFFECVDEIKPSKLFVEVFKSNKARFEAEIKERYPFVKVYESTYYHNKKNKCWIISASSEPFDYPLEGIDEEDAIAWICANVDYKCIGDLCMGKGLVGYHAWKNGKRFVGTELNEKRLAVLVDKVTKGNKQC